MSMQTTSSSKTDKTLDAQRKLFDKVVAKVKARLSEMAAEARAEILDKPDAINATGGHITAWYNALQKYNETGDETFLHAKFGYAVETVVNQRAGTDQKLQKLLLAAQCTIQQQATHGSTRVDYEMTDKFGNKYWFDLTTEKQEGHIFDKASTNYRNPKRADEVTYESLDTTELAASAGAGIGEKMRIQRTAQQAHQESAARRERIIRQLADAINRSGIADLQLSAAEKREKVEWAFQRELRSMIDGLNGLTDLNDGDRLYPRIANSLLRKIGLTPGHFGYGAGSTTSPSEAEQIIQLCLAKH